MDPRSLTNDFKEFLQCLNDQNVEFLVIGGHAVAFYGYPRATSDLDVWIALDATNAASIVVALKTFGFDIPELRPEMFLQKDRVIRMGIAPNRIEIQTGIDGVSFTECYANKVAAKLDGISVFFIALSDLKRNKRASGRNKDLADLDNLP